MARPTENARLWKLAAPVVLALCGLFLVTSGKESGGNDLRVTDTLELSGIVEEQVERTEELDRQARALGAELDSLTTKVGDSTTQELQDEIDQLITLSGLGPVEGPGVTVSLDDADIPDTVTAGQASDYLVHQQDVDAVINGLWAGGAEAMTVMGHRVTQNSVVSCEGPVINVDGRVYSPPYIIAAIGDSDKMIDALGSSRQVANYLSYVVSYGLGWDVQEGEDLYAPGISDTTGLTT
jgi:uncharacterized protein YlxW (UPF0749 family)